MKILCELTNSTLLATLLRITLLVLSLLVMEGLKTLDGHYSSILRAITAPANTNCLCSQSASLRSMIQSERLTSLHTIKTFKAEPEPIRLVTIFHEHSTCQWPLASELISIPRWSASAQELLLVSLTLTKDVPNFRNAKCQTLHNSFEAFAKSTVWASSAKNVQLLGRNVPNPQLAVLGPVAVPQPRRFAKAIPPQLDFNFSRGSDP